MEEKAVLPDMERVLYEMSYARIKGNLATSLAVSSGKERDKIVAVLGRLHLSESGFAEMLRVVIQ